MQKIHPIRVDIILDLGNTNQKIACFDNNHLVDIKQYTKITEEVIEQTARQYGPFRNGILSSVIIHPAALEETLSGLCPFLILDESTPLPVRSSYQTPATLGKDRIAAVIGGHSIFPGSNLLVIVAGSCLTYDFITSESVYAGGAISPGLTMRFRALHTFTGKLPFIEKAGPVPLTGETTETSIRSGVVNGMVAEMEGIVARYSHHYPHMKILISGGDEVFLANRLNFRNFAVPNIVIIGLQKILAFNVQEHS